MKIITNTAVFVQKIDIEFFRYRLHSLPNSIYSKIFENSELNTDDFNKYDFFKFEDTNDIEFFKSVDWIIDYDSVKDLTINEITRIGKSYIEKREQIIKKLYSMATDSEDYNATLLQYTLINYQISSLTDINDFKLGLLKMNLPSDGNKLQKLIKKIFHKKKK